MKGRIALTVLLLITLTVVGGFAPQEKPSKGQIPEKVEEMVAKIHWLGHASFRIDGSKRVYIDPWKLPKETEARKADIILITHEHFDHFSKRDVQKIRTPETVVVCTPDVGKKLKGKHIRRVKPGGRVQIGKVLVEAVPAYNIEKRFHPRGKNWVGYVLTLDGVRIYHAGDTDFIPEMKNLKNIDIALMPVGGTYTMDAKEAAEAVKTFRPKLAIPMHYGDIIGSEKDAQYFQKHSVVPVKILRPLRGKKSSEKVK